MWFNLKKIVFICFREIKQLTLEKRLITKTKIRLSGVKSLSDKFQKVNLRGKNEQI